MGVQDGSQRIHFMEHPVQLAFLLTLNTCVFAAGNIFSDLIRGMFQDLILLLKVSIACRHDQDSHEQRADSNIQRRAFRFKYHADSKKHCKSCHA